MLTGVASFIETNLMTTIFLGAIGVFTGNRSDNNAVDPNDDDSTTDMVTRQ